MKAKELRQKSAKELKSLLKEKRVKLGKLKFELSSKKIKNIGEIKELRRDIARILTLNNINNHEDK